MLVAEFFDALLTVSPALLHAFEMAVRDENGTQAGFIESADPAMAAIILFGEIQYLHQTSAGTYRGVVDGPVYWSFYWTAPDTDVGVVYFGASGMAANNDRGTRGDYIYSSEDYSFPAAQ